MAEYNKRGGDNRGGSFGARGVQSNFVKKSFGARRPSDGPITQYQATCSNCGNSCAVPFKPVNGKPVFCRDCFVKTGDTSKGRAGDRFPRRDFAPRSAPESAHSNSNSNNDVLKQLELLNSKIDRLIAVIEGQA